VRCWFIAVASLLAGCASTSRSLVSEGDFAEASAVEYEASFDEVYDAAWLSLEKLGFTIAAHDRRQGTFLAAPAKDRVGYEVQATPRETRVRLQLALRTFKDGHPELSEVRWRPDGLTAELDKATALHAQVKALLDAWEHPLELAYLKVGHAVLADGMRLPLPPAWNVLDLRTDRRHLKLQLFKRAEQGQNPTLVVGLGRRRPLPSVAVLAQEAAAAAVPDAHTAVPESETRDPVMLGGGLAAWTQTLEIAAEPFDLDLFTFTAETHAWALQAAAACPRPATPDNAPDPACVSAVKGAFAGAGRARAE
jgi:hypothetical protein